MVATNGSLKLSRQVSNWAALALTKLVTEFDKELLLDLHPQYFDGIYAPIFNIVQKYFSDNQKLPTIEALEAEVVAKAPKAQLPIVAGILTSIKNTKTIHIGNPEIVKGLKDKRLLATMDEQIKNLTQASLSKDTDSVRQILNAVVEDVNISRTKPQNFEEAMEAEDDSKILTTGMAGLDQHLIGMAGLTIVAGGSGSGKSSFLLEAAIGQFLAGHSILFISLELSAQVLGKRLKANLTGIPFGKIVSGDLTKKEQQLIAKAMKEFFDRPNSFRVVTTPMDTEELLNLIQVEKSLYNIDACYVDYLNLIGAPKGVVGGWQNLADIAKALHRLSMEIGVVTISASQATLDKAPKGGAYPQITTRGSAELLFSATLLIFLYKPEIEEDTSENSIVLYVMKNRNAAQCQLLMEADFRHMKYSYVVEL